MFTKIPPRIHILHRWKSRGPDRKYREMSLSSTRVDLMALTGGAYGLENDVRMTLALNSRTPTTANDSMTI